MPRTNLEPNRWPVRVLELCERLAPPPDGQPACARTHARARDELWVLLHGALMRYLRDHAGATGRMQREDLEDLASAKALDLATAAEYGRWKVAGRSPAEVASYLSTTARNALVDAYRLLGRELPLETDVESSAGDSLLSSVPDVLSPGAMLEAVQYADALADCVDALAPRARAAWMLRVLLDMPTRAIARHPAVGLKAGHVDVILQRCRGAMRGCMRSKGHDTDLMPPGTFALLWARCARHVREMGLDEEPEETRHVV